MDYIVAWWRQLKVSLIRIDFMRDSEKQKASKGCFQERVRYVPLSIQYVYQWCDEGVEYEDDTK